MSGVQAWVLPLTARGRHLPSSWTHQLHSTHLCTHSSLPAGLNHCGLFMHLTPIPLPAEINSNHMYVFLTVFLLTDHVRFCALVTPALRCRLSCPVFEYCFVFPVGLLFIKELRLTCILHLPEYRQQAS